MQFKAILTVSLLSAAQVAYAAPPPCLMAAVNTQPNPSDFKSICGDNASMVQKQIESVCKGDDLTAALASFADTCRTNGVAVPPVAPSSSTTSGTSSSPSSGSGSASGTSHGSTSATSTGKNGTHTTGTGTGTGTGSVGTSVPAATGGGTKTSGTSGSAAGSAKPSTTSGVAGRLAGSIGGLVMVAAGAIFML